MGLFISKIFDSFTGVKQNQKLLLLGLDGAGKTTILNKLKLNETVHTIPTIGFNCDRIQYNNVEFMFWDIGGQDKIRALWRYYYDNTNCLCFVIDSSDEERLLLAKETLENVLQDKELEGIPLLILANKMDVASKSLDQITQILDLKQYRNREWFIQSACALTGDGLFDGFDWIAKQMKNPKKK